MMDKMILLREWQASQVEFWKPIQGFDGYDVSSFGRVRSWWVRIGDQRGARWEIGAVSHTMSAALTEWGYLRIRLKRDDGVKISTGVHRLVAMAFIPNPENLEQVNHKNVIKLDNRLENLEHMSRSQNIKHAYDCGLFGLTRSGENNKLSKMTTALALEIISRGKTKKRQGAKLAREYGLDKSTVNRLLAGKVWKHLQRGET